MAYSVTKEQKQYETYILSDSEANSQVEVVPEKGGIVTVWKLQDKDIFYLDTERFKDPEKTVRGGIPILFPICGDLPDNIFKHQGKEYQLKQHGVARNLPWQVSKQKSDKSASLTVVLQSNEETKKVYPFDFEITYTYQLKGNTLELLQCYTNKSSEKMPFSFGFHPYFKVGDKNQLKLDIPSSQYKAKGSTEVVSFDGNFDFSVDEIDVAFAPINGQSTSFEAADLGYKLKIDYSNDFSTLVFWTVKGKDFICVEPWSAPRYAINTGEELNYLEPGESCIATMTISVSFL